MLEVAFEDAIVKKIISSPGSKLSNAEKVTINNPNSLLSDHLPDALSMTWCHKEDWLNPYAADGYFAI